MMNNYDAFIKVFKKDLKLQNKINVMLDRYTSLPYEFQSKIGYNSLIQKVILKELIDIMTMTKNDLDIELKMKISRIKYLENKITPVQELILLYVFMSYKRWNVIYAMLK